MPHWNRGKRKYWHSFDSLPIGRLFGLLAKREVKEDFPYYSNRHVIATDIATSTKDINYFLSKFPLECIDIFLFNNPCSTTETVTYDMLEGIKDGHKVSAKYDSWGLFFETPITVMVFSNEFPMLEALKKDQWRIYEIIGEDLYSKTLSATKPKRRLIEADKNYTIYNDWGSENMINGVFGQFLHEQNSY